MTTIREPVAEREVRRLVAAVLRNMPAFGKTERSCYLRALSRAALRQQPDDVGRMVTILLRYQAGQSIGSIGAELGISRELARQVRERALSEVPARLTACALDTALRQKQAKAALRLLALLDLFSAEAADAAFDDVTLLVRSPEELLLLLDAPHQRTRERGLLLLGQVKDRGSGIRRPGTQA